MARQVTVTLTDNEVAARLEEEARRRGVSVDEVTTEAARRGLGPAIRPADEPFRIEARLLRAREGVSFECIGRLIGELEEETWRK